MGFLYYSVSRPLGPGCFPKPADNSITEIINYNERVYVSSIGRSVWGSIEYSSPLTETDISAYELIPFPVKKEYGVSLDRFLEKYGVRLLRHENGKSVPATLSNFDIAVTKGLEKIVGMRVWIFDCRNSNDDILGRPVRNIPPTLVEIADSRQARKTIYYSPIFFRPISKTGKVLKKEISPFDTTGYHAYTGVSVLISESEQDANDGYRKMAKAAVSARMDYIQKKTNELRKWAETLGITEEEDSVHGS